MYEIEEPIGGDATRTWTRLDLTDVRRLARWLGVEIDPHRLAAAAARSDRPGPPSWRVRRAFADRGVMLTRQQAETLAERAGISQRVLEAHVPVEARADPVPAFEPADPELDREREERIRARKAELRGQGEGFGVGDPPFLQGVER